MAKNSPAGQTNIQIRWVEICRVMRLMGQMDYFSKAKCLRIAKLLKKQIQAGTAKKLSRGMYTFVLPQKKDAMTDSAP